MPFRCPACGTEMFVLAEGTFTKRCPECGALWEFRFEAQQAWWELEEEEERWDATFTCT